jgi:hypothetical protein
MVLEARICSSVYSSWNWAYLVGHNKRRHRHGTIRVIDRVLVVLPRNLRKVLLGRACARQTRTDHLSFHLTCTLSAYIHNAVTPSPPSLKSRPHTVLLHVLASCIAKHLGCRRGWGKASRLHHDADVLVHWVGAVSKLPGVTKVIRWAQPQCTLDSSEPRSIFSKPSARMQSETPRIMRRVFESEGPVPPWISWHARNSAVEPVEQLLLTCRCEPCIGRG